MYAKIKNDLMVSSIWMSENASIMIKTALIDKH